MRETNNGMEGSRIMAQPHPIRSQSAPSVLMTAEPLSGLWTYAMELARELSAAGIEISLAVMGAPSADQRAEAHKIPLLDLHHSRYRPEWADDPMRDIDLAGEWLLSLEEMLNPDVIHLNGYVHGALPWRGKVVMVGHSCLPAREEILGSKLPAAARQRYHAAVATGLRAADLVVTATRSLMSSLVDHYGIEPGRVIRHGRNPAAFAPSEKEPLILAVGRLWDEAKNIAALDRIAPRLPWPVLVAGEQRDPTGGLVRFDKLSLLGRLPERQLAQWYGRAAIFTAPALYEPFGLAVLEAALSGCALVLNDLPSFRELWQGAALFVPPDDPDALAGSLTMLVHDRPLREAMGNAARNRAAGYGAKAMAEAYRTAYGEAAALKAANQYAEEHQITA